MLQGWDDNFYYFWLPSAVIDHDLDFSNQLADRTTMDATVRDAGLAQPRTATGLLPNKYPPGWALASLPFFLAAHVFAPAGATGFEPGYLLAVWAGQLLYAAAGLWLAIKLVRRLVPGAPATTAVLSVWLASPLIYYQTARLSMSHSLVFTLAVAVFWLAQRVEDGDLRPRIWVALGFCSALLVATRNVAIVYLAIPAVLAGPRLRSVKPAGWLALGAAVPAAAQLAAWKVLFGSWLVYSYEGERFDFAHPHVAAVLFSPRHGWFYWHPLLLVGIAAFCVWAWRRRDGRAGLVSLGAIIVLNAAWAVWWLGSSFGHRGFEAATLFAMLGLAVLLRAAPAGSWLRRIVASGVALAVGWNLVLGALFLTQRISRGDAVTYADAGRAFAAWVRGPD
ncbi:MAG: hypothetical protein A3G75_11280 [Verrucomicrobia bacterium RIFCSPLOWO2_12_FULL_64_8]|nr:MAG: hypothetical protein A3G75_11280 [Verrucomicrobia bacterium RIFCSPLOWO2_12_FULL_64_8]